jgi:hypothetical protein
MHKVLDLLFKFEKNKIDFNKATVWGIITTLLLMFFCKLIF